MVNVMERCPEKGDEFLLLLALANRADEDGRNVAWEPAPLALAARLSERALERAAQKLLKKGRVSLERGAGPQGGDLLHLHFPDQALALSDGGAQ